jgi:hypothetical protein
MGQGPEFSAGQARDSPHVSTYESASAKSIAARHDAWKDDVPADEAALWDWLVVLDDASRLALLAHCISFGVNALFEKVDRHGGPGITAHAQGNALARLEAKGQCHSLLTHELRLHQAAGSREVTDLPGRSAAPPARQPSVAPTSRTSSRALSAASAPNRPTHKFALSPCPARG